MKVSFILDSIDAGNVVLPEFQRGYVWSRDQVKGLIQSLYQRYPVGGLLIWNTRADSTDLRGVSNSTADTVKLLLDGQQRVTSLYGVLTGEAPPFFEDPERARAFTGLYFHLDREVFEFYRQSTMADDPLWVSVTSVMKEGPEAVTQSLTSVTDLDTSQVVTYISRLQRLHGIRDVDLHDENISGEDKTVDVVVDIFNRVNSGGTKLSKGDLALARLCAIRPEARNELRDAIARWSQSGFHFSIDWFLRCINVVVTGKARFEALKDIAPADFGTGLKKAEQAIDFVLNLISTRLGLDHDRVLMGRYGIPAMVKVVVDAGGSITDGSVQNRLLFWYIHQSAWGRYSGSTETVLERDLEAIEDDGVEGLIRQMELSRGTLQIRPEDFDVQTVGSRFYPILYMLTRVNDARDLLTGMPLTAHLLGRGSKLEVHHVFPKAVLYKAGFSRRQVNAVGNYAFLTGDSNRSLSATEPTSYFPRVSADNPGVLTSQWISDDPQLWKTENYLQFLADRRTRLAVATNTFLDSLLGGGSELPDLTPTEGVVELPDEESLSWLDGWCEALGLSAPETLAELGDPDEGPTSIIDALWRDGMQEGRTEPVALLRDRDPDAEAQLGEAGVRFFTSVDALQHYVERLLNVDLDGDGVIGSPEEAQVEQSASDEAHESAEVAAFTEAEFHEAMLGIYARAKSEASYNANYFIQMVAEQGGLATARQLIGSPAPSQGFTHLWERGRLDLTVEALVLDPRSQGLFSATELEMARRRLAEFGFEA